MDLYLKFTDEPQANSVLYTEVPTEWDDEGMPIAWYTQPNYANIDTIGVIYEPMPDPLPEPPPEPVAMEGWHVNVRVVAGEDAEPLQQFSVVPQSPRRVWG